MSELVTVMLSAVRPSFVSTVTSTRSHGPRSKRRAATVRAKSSQQDEPRRRY